MNKIPETCGECDHFEFVFLGPVTFTPLVKCHLKNDRDEYPDEYAVIQDFPPDDNCPLRHEAHGPIENDNNIIKIMVSVKQILDELARAESKYPEWPSDSIHQISIMQEESGESIRAALNHVYHGAPLDDLKKELIQTGAMVIRCLKNLPTK